MLYNAADQGAPLHLKWTEAAARQFGIRVFRQEVRQAGEFDAALAALARERPDGLLIFTDPLITANRKRILDFAKDHRLPVLCEFKHLADDGCLVSYGPTFAEMSERVARQADRILRGAEPAALPIEQPTRMEMVINRATANALGITIPPAILLRADKLIE